MPTVGTEYPMTTSRAEDVIGSVDGQQGWRTTMARMREMEDGCGRRMVDLMGLVNLVEFKVGPV